MCTHGVLKTHNLKWSWNSPVFTMICFLYVFFHDNNHPTATRLLPSNHSSWRKHACGSLATDNARSEPPSRPTHSSQCSKLVELCWLPLEIACGLPWKLLVLTAHCPWQVFFSLCLSFFFQLVAPGDWAVFWRCVSCMLPWTVPLASCLLLTV